jgi:hypothetical protein
VTDAIGEKVEPSSSWPAAGGGGAEPSARVRGSVDPVSDGWDWIRANRYFYVWVLARNATFSSRSNFSMVFYENVQWYFTETAIFRSYATNFPHISINQYLMHVTLLVFLTSLRTKLSSLA